MTPYILVIKNFMTPPYFSFQEFMTPCISAPPPIPKENPLPPIPKKMIAELCTGLENAQTAVVTDASNFQTDVNICLMAVKRPSYCLRILASNLRTDVNLCLIAVETAVLLFKKLASIWAPFTATYRYFG